MTRHELINQIKSKGTFLCVGLDPDTGRIPAHIIEEETDPIYEFNRQIIDATAKFCVAFKPNSAFYESYGLSGIESLEKTIRYIKANYPDHFLIADAKRGDIGNTSEMYAKAFFKRLNADAITVAPYMGADSVKPFLSFPGKWTIVLALTSNEGSADFQQLDCGGRPLYKRVIEAVCAWGNADNTMFVVGATRTEVLSEIRQMIPDHFLLVPGVGAQGGDLAMVCEKGMNTDCGLLVNASRSIIYASAGKDFAEKAADEAAKLTAKMKAELERRRINTN
jgi:orotidine-5'-phosphate decarboxylase